ncbi:MAG: ATP-binding cassette domain-containing protein, partial [Clostridia bacterium]|nr:ATP-binding cassette domain-containing protein [Clostridia bacterium]
VEENDKRFRMEIKQESIFIFIGPIGTMAQYINEIILLVVASAMVRSGGMKQYQLVSLYNYFLLFMSNAFMLSAIWQNLKMSHGSGAVIGKLASTTEEDLVSGTPVSEIGTIRGNEIRFAYDEDRQILDGVSFTIPQGKITAIVGENGCGKSTLVKLLERFNVESSGTVEVDGKDLSTLNLHDWRESVGYLFQGNQIIRGTIRENIAYGVHREFTEEELIDAAKQAKAYDFIMDKDDGFDTVISRFDSKVSGGEMQRIAIARMILKRPKLLIMDEATSGIDVVSEKEVMEALMNMMKNRTVIMVSHDFNLIRKADNLIVLKDGRVEAGGTYREVYETSPLLREFEAKSGC